MINCVNCGKVFEPRTKRGHPPKFCCVDCKIEHSDKGRGGRAAKKGSKLHDIEIICPICSKKFVATTKYNKSVSCPECRKNKEKQERNIVIKTACLGCGCSMKDASKNLHLLPREMQLFHNKACAQKFYNANKTEQEMMKRLHDFAMAKLLGEHLQDLSDFIDSAKMSDELTRLVMRK